MRSLYSEDLTEENDNLDQASAFGQALWHELVSRPFVTSNKRELEVMILQAAADARSIDEIKPAATATLLFLSLARTYSYLSDLAQRRPALQDKDALILLGEQLARVEVIPTDKHLSIPLQRADLRIWLERRLALQAMVRIHLLLQWYALSDPAMEDALIEVPAIRRFTGIAMISDRI